MLTLKTKLARLILAAILVGLSAGLMFAAESQVAAAKSANAAASNLVNEQGGVPLETTSGGTSPFGKS